MQKTLLFFGIISVYFLGISISGGTEAFAQCDQTFLIHSNHPDGNTTFTDSSSSSYPITPNGNVHHETDQARFGQSSISFDGSGDYLEIPDSDDWDFTTSDGTIDFWLRITETGRHHNIIGQARAYNDSQWAIYVNTSQAIAIGKYGQTEIKSGDGAISPNVWYHVAVVREGPFTKIYVDGVTVASGSSPEWSSSSNTLRIGSGRLDPLFDVNGYLDEIRILKGTAAWTSDFTPPNLPYCYSGTLIELEYLDATGQDGAVLIQWGTASEIDNEGFNILRSTEEYGVYVRINDTLIPAEGGPLSGADYEYTDNDVENDTTYWYKLEDVDVTGLGTMHGPVSATPSVQGWGAAEVEASTLGNGSKDGSGLANSILLFAPVAAFLFVWRGVQRRRRKEWE